MHALEALGLAVGLSLAALAAERWKLGGVRAPARLTADPARRTFRVATRDRPRVMSRRGLHLPDHRRGGGVRGEEGHHLRARGRVRPRPHHESLAVATGVLITNAPGENPVIEGWSSIADYQAILGLWQVSNIAIQGLTIQNTGVTDAEHGHMASGSAAPAR